MTPPAPRQPKAPNPQRAYLTLALLLAARLAVGWLYTVSVPIWEADNEDGHFAYARYLAQHHTLLNLHDPEAAAIWEKIQPPLYYMVVAVFLLPFKWEGPFVAPDLNPYLGSGLAGSNYALHPPVLQGAAYTTAAAVGVARDVGVVISAIGVLFVFLSARRLWPGRPSLVWAATCLYAFWPQFLFTGSMVSNDVLVAALSAAFLYYAITLVMDGLHWRTMLLAGGLVGAALLTKANAFALFPVAALALALGWRGSRRSWRQLILVGLVVGLAAAAVWLLVSQKLLSQAVFKANALPRFWSYLLAMGTPQQSRRVVEAARYIFRTFLASYGWGNLDTYPWLYQLWLGGFGLAALGGSLALFRRGGEPRRRLNLLLWTEVISFVAIAIALAVLQQNIFVPGRYLLPALPAVIFLLLSGWLAWVPNRWQGAAGKALGVSLVLVGSSIPLGTLIPIYAIPQPVAANVLQDLQPIRAVLADKLELLGYLPSRPGTAGQTVDITLCWQASAPVETNYTVMLDVVGPDGQGYGGLSTFPGHGNYATSFWRVNTPFCDRYTVPIAQGIPAPSRATVQVGLLDRLTNRWAPLTQLNGQPHQPQTEAAPAAPALPYLYYLPIIANHTGLRAGGPPPPPNPDASVIPFKVKPAATSAVSLKQPVEYHFGQAFVLRGYELQPATSGQRGVKVALLWQATQAVSQNYVVFVHLRDTPTHAFAQGDSEPRGGWYPTQWWEAGETVVDEHTITLPTGALPSLDLYVGLYDPATSERLPVTDAQGRPVANDEVLLAQKLALP